MKYKKQIATSALAISLLVGGSSVFAATPQDLGIKNVQKIYQKQNNSRVKIKKQNNIVGVIYALTGTGFTINVKNLKTKVTSSVDVKTNISTVYTKNGMAANILDIISGQKVIVVGNLDKITNTITAKTVKIVK